MGTPVKIRDYPRSCKFYSKVVHSEATAGMSGGKAYNRNKSEDLPEYFCLIRSFRVKGDRINELVNCTWCVQGSGHLHAIYLDVYKRQSLILSGEIRARLSLTTRPIFFLYFFMKYHSCLMRYILWMWR